MLDKQSLTGNIRRIRPAYEQVADQLRQLILQSDLVPGQRLPTEPELTVLFGVSRSTIREALRALSSDRLITTVRGVKGGSFVAHPEPEHISNYLQASLGLLSGALQLSIDDLLEARELLEVPAARLAALRRSEAQIVELRALATAPNSIEAFSENRNFHLAVLQASGNMLLGVMTRPVFAVLQARFLRHEASRNEWGHIHDAHEAILSAIEAGDGDLAAALMLEHLEHLRPTYNAIDVAARRNRAPQQPLSAELLAGNLGGDGDSTNEEAAMSQSQPSTPIPEPVTKVAPKKATARTAVRTKNASTDPSIANSNASIKPADASGNGKRKTPARPKR